MSSPDIAIVLRRQDFSKWLAVASSFSASL
jgi:hypothetical protein